MSVSDNNLKNSPIYPFDLVLIRPFVDILQNTPPTFPGVDGTNLLTTNLDQTGIGFNFKIP
jgi:hypothetical protein